MPVLILTYAPATSSTSGSAKSSPSRPSNLTAQEQSRRSLYAQASQNAAAPTFRRYPSGQTKDSSMSFIYLTESIVGQPQRPVKEPTPVQPKARRRSSSSKENGDDQTVSPEGQIDRINRLFEILSARSDIDHPICVECTDMLVEGLQKKLEVASKEREAYVKHLKEIQASQPSDSDLKAQHETLRKSEQDCAAAMKELKKLETQKDTLDEEILALEEESQQLQKEEELFWAERNAFATKMADFQSERDSVNAKFNNDSHLLDKLQRTNVYNDTFCISHDGSFATINGLRLGRLSSKPVDWPEINAAWGHALLLLVTVAEKLNYKFHGFEPQPLGSTSKIIKIEQPSPASSRQSTRTPQPAAKKHALELYSSGDMPLGLTFMHRKFDNAMVAFLELVKQLGAHVHEQTMPSGRPLKLPYSIDGEKIGDISIKLGIAQDDGWTKACKFTLTCCKFLLAHASNMSQ